MSNSALTRLRVHCSVRRGALCSASHLLYSPRASPTSHLRCALFPLPSLSLSTLLPFPTRLLSTTARADKKAAYQRRSFQDRVRIQVTGGRGGNGCSSFARTFKGIGAPNGGSGGRGGDVYVQCGDDSTRGYTFSSYHFKGGIGHSGNSDNKGGKRGEDVTITVPRGTVVSRITGRDAETGELKTERVGDLDEMGVRMLVARGGEGGWGNRAFVTGYRSNNRFSSTGVEGESEWLLLELRVIADVGLVGFPNAGKSSLLDAVSNAQPQIASYPFTTLQPQVGVVQVAGRKEEAKIRPDASTPMDSFTMADLPGLIDDAHLDVGLGHSFLQHLHRCPLLLYVVDASGAGEPARDPCEDFVSLRKEVRLYDERLMEKPWLVFANQMDRKKREAKRHLKRLKEVVEVEVELEGGERVGRGRVLNGSCVTREGIDELVQSLWEAKGRADEAAAKAKVEAARRTAQERMETEERVAREAEDRQRRYREYQQRRHEKRARIATNYDHPLPPAVKLDFVDMEHAESSDTGGIR